MHIFFTNIGHTKLICLIEKRLCISVSLNSKDKITTLFILLEYLSEHCTGRRLLIIRAQIKMGIDIDNP